MSIKESGAAALVRFTGLGIIVFNEESARGEIAVIRDQSHRLSMSIKQARYKEGADKDLIVYENLFEWNDLPREGVSVSISTRGESSVQGYEKYQAEGEFDRLSSEDPNDFRWLVNMGELHSGAVTSAKSGERHPASRLFVENGLFYVHRLETEVAFYKVRKDADGMERQREVFGCIAETIGVKLDADTALFSVSVGEKSESVVLPKGSLPYLIEIRNMNYDENAAVSDMPDYYKYVRPEYEETFELEPVESEDSPLRQAGSVNGRVFCHPVEGGGGDIRSIDDLI